MSRTRARNRPMWRWVAVAVMVIAALGFLVWHSREPWGLALEGRARTQEMERQLQAERAKAAELRRQQERLRTPEGMETEARRQGWVKPDEEIVNLPDRTSED